QGQSHALRCQNPISSRQTTTSFGASFGALTSKRGGALALRASSSVLVGGCGSGTGSTVRLICCPISGNGSKLKIATGKCISGEFFFTISDFIVIGFFPSSSLTLPKSRALPHPALDVDVALSAVRNIALKSSIST